jgi:TRAP-type C4-dicarboxylate transport system permease small subunit
MGRGGDVPGDQAASPTAPSEDSSAGQESQPGLGAGIGTPELLPERGRLRTILKGLGLAEQAIGTAFIGVILALVLIQVAQRYIHTFGGWPWTGEIARLSLVWCTFVLSGYLMAQDRHITIKVIDLVMGGRALAIVKLASHLIVTVTCLAMAYATYRLIAEGVGQRTPAAGLPVSWTYVLPLIGFVLTALRGVMAVVLLDAREIREGRSETT